MEEKSEFSSWAIVEQLGHKRLAGHVSGETIAGAPMLRVDVPDTVRIVDVYNDGEHHTEGRTTAAFTTFVAPSSVYRLTPVSEEIAREAAKQFLRYESPLPIEMPRLIPATTTADEEEDDIDQTDPEWEVSVE